MIDDYCCMMLGDVGMNWGALISYSLENLKLLLFNNPSMWRVETRCLPLTKSDGDLTKQNLRSTALRYATWIDG